MPSPTEIRAPTEAGAEIDEVTAARGRRLVLAVAALAIVLAAAATLTLMVGVKEISASEVFDIVLRGGGERVSRIVVMSVRLPRHLLGLLAGAALGIAGVMLQDSLRNPLAEPALLGVSAGGSLVVAVIVVFAVPAPPGTLPLFALAGGLVAGFIILGATRLTTDPVRMILIGAALAALFSALITATIALADPNNLPPHPACWE